MRAARGRGPRRSRPRANPGADTGAAGTDIHDGLLLAQRVFDAYPEAGSRSLVLLSDMVERSARLNVTRVRPDDASIASTIDGLAADGLIPDLRGVQAYVVGAGVSQGGRHAGRPVPGDPAVLAGVPVAGRRGAAVGPVRRRARAVPIEPKDDDFPEPPFSIEPVVGWRVWHCCGPRAAHARFARP